jgi:hypothetical protein
MQDIIDFFNNAAVKLPLIRSAADNDFQKYVKDSLARYTDFIEALPASRFNTAVKERIAKIKTLTSAIDQAIAEYFNGYPHKAYQSLHDALEHVKDNLLQLKSPNETFSELYRFRIARPDEWLSQKADLFHIPFDLRKKVIARRYSIPGLPCLYLGGSLYVCWIEMDRPSFDSIFTARFKVAPGQTVNIIDMAKTPKYLAWFVQKELERERARGNDTPDLGPQNNSFLLNNAICWPLIAACSIRRPACDRNADFVSEYIIPQLLLQWVTTQLDLDGICYFSVRTDATGYCHPGIANYVFPARALAATGYCETLRNKFEMTYPISWQIMATAQNATAQQSQNQYMEIELVPNDPVVYYQTTFCHMEYKVLEKEFARMPRPV